MLNCGKPEIFLPIIHYTLFNYSEKVVQYLYDNNYDIYAKNDLDKILKDINNCLFEYKKSPMDKNSVKKEDKSTEDENEQKDDVKSIEEKKELEKNL